MTNFLQTVNKFYNKKKINKRKKKARLRETSQKKLLLTV